MQPCSREMQALMIQQQSLMSLQDLQNGQQMHHNDSSSQMSSHFDPASSHDDFLDQMLSTLPSSCSWPELSGATPKSLPWEDQFEDQSTFLASKLRQHQITAGGSGNQTNAAAKSLMLQQQLMLSRGLGGGLRSPTGAPGCGESGFIPMPLSLTSADSYDQSQNDIVDASSFKSQGGNNSVQALFNGFNGGLNQPQHFHNPQGGTIQAQNFGAPSPVMNQAPANGSAGGAPAQPRQRVRARRGQATDPHSIAERLRRERIAERMKSLQELVPNGNKTDKASMLDEIIDYVKFLQLQVKVLSMSRLGGAGAVAPLVTTDISPEGGGDCFQGSGATGGRSTQTAASSSNDSMTVTEHQVAKLMEEDMGSAMQYLQGKGLCLMPISLATAISTATCQPTTRNNFHHPLTNPLLQSNGEGGATSPTMSVLTVQSASMGNGLTEASVKDATSVSKP